MRYYELKEKIEECGTHTLLGPYGNDWGIEQNPHELADFLESVGDLGVPIKSVLEVGTGYKAGLSRFLSKIMGWEVTTVDVQTYSTQVKVADVHYYVRDSGLFRMQWTDLVFLDGPRTYEGIEEAWKFYKPRCRVIALHDIAGLRGCEAQAKFWKEVSRTPKRGAWRKGFHQTVADDFQAAGIGWYTK